MDKYLAIREKIDEAIEKNLKEIAELSDYIADHPEVSGEEYETSKKLVETLEPKVLRQNTRLQDWKLHSEPSTALMITSIKLLY